MSQNTHVIENLLDKLENCYSLVEEEYGVFSTKFDRDKAEHLIRDYQDQRLVGRGA